jgi:hypothetical protein
MSGYLQRMVTSAARRDHTMHPLVGGLFVKPPEQGVMEESAMQSVPTGPQRADPISEAVDARRDAETNQFMKTDETVERMVAVREPPLMAAKSGLDDVELPAAGKRDQGTTQAKAERKPQEVFSLAARAKRQVEPPVAETTEPFKTPLLMTEEDQPAPRVQKNERARPVQQPATFRPAVQPSGAQQGRGSEEIQIHIGRVEVIAVPPPAQRTVPAAARKTESLGEYLRRRDRRVR